VNDLFFAETASLHRLSPCWRTGSLKTPDCSGEQVSRNGLEAVAIIKGGGRAFAAAITKVRYAQFATFAKPVFLPGNTARDRCDAA